MPLNRRPELGRRIDVEQYLKRAVRRQVYVAWDPILKRRVVVKRYADVSDARHERNVMRRYPNSRHLVRYHRFVASRRGGLIVMEWVRGITVAQIIAQNGILSSAKIRAIALDVLEGLRILHGAGYVHGDMHGPNVIVTDLASAKTKLIDFQHAVPIRCNGTARARRILQIPLLKFGPECQTGVIDPAFDTYGVGFISASLLLGIEPVSRDQLLEPRLRRAKYWPVIERALHPDPLARYRSAAAMQAALRSIR